MKENAEKRFCIIGAGLAGTLISIFLAKRGIASDLYDKRLDMRKSGEGGGRSIVMSLSERGWRALNEVGIEKEIRKLTIPKYARLVHNEDGTTSYQKYGKDEQALYTINRKVLNSSLMNLAESTGLVKIYFNYKAENIDLDEGKVIFKDLLYDKIVTKKYEHIIGADGIFSIVRKSIAQKIGVNDGLINHKYVYKEFIIPGKDGRWTIDENVVHLWPRKNCFFLAMPNNNYTHTCTLFFSSSGLPGLDLNNEDQEDEILKFFKKNFPEVVQLIPNIAEEFLSKKTSNMYSVENSQWNYKDKALIIGDASHAIVVFYAMGMNVAFEDCRILNNLIDEYSGDWKKIFSEFFIRRKAEADAILQLSMNNLYNIYNSVQSDFVIKWELERKIWEIFPDDWMPRYAWVPFSHLPFTKVVKIVQKQNEILDYLRDKMRLNSKADLENCNEELFTLANPLLYQLNGLSEYINLSLNLNSSRL